MATRDWRLEINPRNFDGRLLSEEKILDWFEQCEAVWIHDGNTKSPHVQLHSGLCSNGYFDCQRVLRYPRLSEIIARQVAQKLRESGVPQPDWVVSSAYGAITVGHEVAKVLGAQFMYLEKDPEQDTMIWRRITIPKDSTVLSIEELITLGETIDDVMRAVEEGNREPVKFLPFAGAIIYRPPTSHQSLKVSSYYTPRKKIGEAQVRLPPIKIIALIERKIWAVPPESCPLCKAGSPRISQPKTRWTELTGKA